MSVKYATAAIAGFFALCCLTAGEVLAQAGDRPEVIPRGDGEVEVVFDNGCRVYYNASGARPKDLPACRRDQLRYADRAAESYRYRQGLDHRDRDRDRYDDRAPEIIAENDYVRVEFRNGCRVVYEDSGRRVKVEPVCRDRQVRYADEAMAVYRREQGYDRRPKIIAENDYVRVEFDNGCRVVYEEYSGRRVKTEPVCRDRQIRYADREFDAYRRQWRY